ncbi:hypothetical protein LK09_00995 [Microbacterium mangrovi]|uniref:ABC transporter domain-containing protein n=1 Tax=Microbacterium mangrovi TaxID=1348253 RepID=A0A0B2A8Q3_9MICO|nr:ABC transporter ATP-binding protein [Microbacterium mangrovi]KHK99933.1 hypothetical protein LK09_00995 [Microbacterium mangrovi]
MADDGEVRWDDVHKKFGSVAALDGFSMHAGPGVHCVLGANGAGKSTAFAVLTGARRPDTGTVTVGGTPVRRGGPASRLIGFAPQAMFFPLTVTVREAVAFVAAHYPNRADVDEVLDAVGMTTEARRLCGGLSGGQTRRLGLACALVGQTPVLVLDEPVAGLDRPGQKLLHALIRRLGDEGRTVLVASHDLAEVDEIADTVTLVARGRVLLTDTAEGVRNRLGSVRVSFTADDAALRTLTTRYPGLEPALDGEGRRSVVTDRPDDIARVILNECDDPHLRVHDRTLAEALDALLDEAGAPA